MVGFWICTVHHLVVREKVVHLGLSVFGNNIYPDVDSFVEFSWWSCGCDVMFMVRTSGFDSGVLKSVWKSLNLAGGLYFRLLLSISKNTTLLQKYLPYNIISFRQNDIFVESQIHRVNFWIEQWIPTMTKPNPSEKRYLNSKILGATILGWWNEVRVWAVRFSHFYSFQLTYLF